MVTQLLKTAVTSIFTYFLLKITQQNKTRDIMGSCNSCDLIVEARIHTDKTTCNIEEPQQKNTFERLVDWTFPTESDTVPDSKYEQNNKLYGEFLKVIFSKSLFCIYVLHFCHYLRFTGLISPDGRYNRNKFSVTQLHFL